jgi:hypothetical protein
MKVLNKLKTFHILIILLCGISFGGKGTPLYGDDYVKVWDSGSTIPNPVFDAAVGDTDNDGKPEIIAAEFSWSGGAKVYVFENTGDNSYQLVWHSGTALTMRISRVTIGDQDSDGNLEIIAAESHDLLPHNAKVHVFENIGDNDYQEVWHSGSDLDGMEITSLFLGDADNDGKREIIIGAGYHWSNCKLRVYENTGDNAYREVWNSGNTTGDSVAEGAVGDTDGDGKMEIIVGSGGIERAVHVFENIGDNSYDLVTTISGFGKSPQAAIGDQDKDGRMEIIVGSQEEELAVRVFEHTGLTGDNAYTEVWNSGTLDGRIYQPASGDQDHDGKREIIAPCLDACKVYVFENSGDNDYQEVWNSGNVIGGLIQYIAAGDQDGDGKGEIIVPSYDGKVYVFENWVNQAPDVEAGLTQTVEQETPQGTEITQMGHAYDADGDALTYQWKEGDTALATGTIPAPNTPPTDTDVSLTHMFPPGVYTVTLFVSDGEISSSDDVLIIVEDTLTPVSTLTTNPTVPDGLDGWFKSAVQVTITAEDTGSGIKEIYYKKDSASVFTVVHGDQAVFSPGDGTYTIEYYAVDKTGHEESPHNFYSFKVDTVNPGTTESIHGNGSGNTYINHAAILLEASDTMSGIKAIHYMINNNETVVSNSKAAINLNQVGTYTIEYWAMDNAGNRETHHSLQIEIISPHTGVAMIKKITANLPNSAFAKNAQNLKNALLNKLDQVIAAIDSGQYADAVKKLLNDIYKKMDGCFNSGVPDKNDWIIDCQVQSRLNNWIKILIIGLTEIRKR